MVQSTTSSPSNNTEESLWPEAVEILVVATCFLSVIVGTWVGWGLPGLLIAAGASGIYINHMMWRWRWSS